MIISRRQFLKYCTVAAGALGLTTIDLMNLEKALANESGAPVIWVNGQSCTGCTVSLANSTYYTTLEDLLISTIKLKTSETLMGAAGIEATKQADLTTEGFVLAVEGAIPTSTNGHFCDIGSWGVTTSEQVIDVVQGLASHTNCVAILAVGTCASFGGIPAAEGNVTGAKGLFDKTFSTSVLSKQIQQKLVCIPGCPPNPNWIVGTIAYMLAHGLKKPALDALRRPRTYYGERICNNCDRFARSLGTAGAHFINNKDANQLGDLNLNKPSGDCLKKVGCKGSRTKSDCSLRKWHSAAYSQAGVNWCVGAGAPCQGCTQINWPDRFSPFHYLP